MRALLVSILVFVALVAAVTGCGRSPRYDARLVRADSLMRDTPDSALAILEAVDNAGLATEGDRAYRDLLLTQARYRCYITATSDSAINRALDYYRRHSTEREKLTRAHIYKGAVMEELGHPDSAMLYYKHAEATADPDDHFNLGYTKLRIGSLYVGYYAFDGSEIEKYEEALDHFDKIGDQEYLHKCKNNLGCLYRESDPVKAEKLLNQAKSISLQRNDTVSLIDDIHALTLLHYYYERYNQALKLVHEVERLQLAKECLSFDFCTTAANVYAKVGKPDSAMIYLRLAEQYDYQNDDEKHMYYLESLGEIELARGDTNSYNRLTVKRSRLSNSMLSNGGKITITRTENAYDKAMDKAADDRHDLLKMALIILASLAAVAGIFIVVRYIHNINKEKQYRQHINDLKTSAQEQLRHLSALQLSYDRIQIKDEHIKEFIDSQMLALSQVLSVCYRKPNNKLSEQIKDILKYQEKDQQNWDKFFDYIDIRFENIISSTREHFPQLDNKDLMLIALCCMDYSYIQIATILDYSNATSVGTIKSRLAKKMGLKDSLNDYIALWARH